LFEGEEADNALITTVLSLQGVDEATLSLELDEEIEAGGLFLDCLLEFAETPILEVHNLTAVLGDNTLEFANQLFDLNVRENRGSNENGFVSVHN
jgi:hypothetical protein